MKFSLALVVVALSASTFVAPASAQSDPVTTFVEILIDPTPTAPPSMDECNGTRNCDVGFPSNVEPPEPTEPVVHEPVGPPEPPEAPEPPERPTRADSE